MLEIKKLIVVLSMLGLRTASSLAGRMTHSQLRLFQRSRVGLSSSSSVGGVNGGSGDLDALFEAAAVVAQRAARKAGSEILAGMGAAVKNEKLNFKDIVTEVRLINKSLFHPPLVI